ncbi:hypothetical protein Pfo_005508 [Paulownia fortunei]|nr:hypothetical protein Pfo_005508 [Paulownia fortunei]
MNMYVWRYMSKKISNCIQCGATRFEYKSSAFCCDNGKIKLAHIETEKAIEFRTNIHPFNCIFSFTSFGVKLDKEVAFSRQGVYTFQVQGMMYHDLLRLIPKEDYLGHFQLYFVETENEVENRMNMLENSTLSEVIVNKLIKILEVNPYGKMYNSLTIDQVVAIWVEGNNVNVPFERDVVVHAHSGDRYRINHYYRYYDPLQYPLLFLRGETGCHQNIKKKKKVIPSEYIFMIIYNKHFFYYLSMNL